MGLDQYAQVRNKKIDFSKVYSKDYKPQRDGFVWRKHARLQTFMQNKFFEQNPNLGDVDFNCKDLIIDKKLLKNYVKKLKVAITFLFVRVVVFGDINSKKTVPKSTKNKTCNFVIGY